MSKGMSVSQACDKLKEGNGKIPKWINENFYNLLIAAPLKIPNYPLFLKLYKIF